MSDPKRKLADLPTSTDKYFKGADIERVELKKPKKCNHHFNLVKAQEAECQNCQMGLFLNIGDEVKDGHIYTQNKLVI